MDVSWILIGEIVATQGNIGEVKVFPHTEFPERFSKMRELHLFSNVGQLDCDLILSIESCRFHKEQVVLKLEGIDSISDAERLKGMKIQVRPEELVPLPEGRHYVFQLIGLKVVSEDGSDVGVITDVLQTGANDVYVVKPVSGVTDLKQVLIPVIDPVVKDIDLETNTVTIHLMDGLLE